MAKTKIILRSKKNAKKNFLNSLIDYCTLNFNRRQNVILFSLTAIFFLILVRVGYIQWFRCDYTDEFVKKVVRKKSIEKPTRGSILDRNGDILAMSIKKYNLFIDTKMVMNLENLQNMLKSFGIELNQNHINRIKKANTHYLPIAYYIDESVVLKLKDKIAEVNRENAENRKKLKQTPPRFTDFDCIGYEEKFVRQYPDYMAAHVIGRTDPEGNGLEGIENYCNSILTGREVEHEAYKVGSKRIISDDIVREESNNGKNVYLTIDKRLQFILEQELAAGLNNTKAKHAIGIIENPHNGEILAMASLPDYTLGKKVESYDILRNNAISLVIEPGSTFKIVVMSACLEEGLVKPADKINCENGVFKIAGNKPITDHEKQKIISAARVMEVSSNIGTAKIAMKLGKELFYKYIRLFGFGIHSGIELNGEEKGILREPSKWSGRSLHTISFGQELSTTPLQIINAFSVIANGGSLLKPHIIKQIGNDMKTASQRTEIRRVLSEETAAQMREILSGVIKNGTGKSAAVPGYSVAGKTGTAQKIDEITRTYSTKHYYASFCGMIPAKKPELVILVAFNEPKGSYYAASVAAPVFSKIAARAMEYMKIPKDEIIKEPVKKQNKVKK